MNLTIAFITSRKEPKVEWFFDSLNNQVDVLDSPKVIVISSNKLDLIVTPYCKFSAEGHLPKPTIWQGPHRITKEDWWAKSNALNTAICLCKTDWIAFVDDRCVLGPEWLTAVKSAMAGNYAVCGSYEKRANMKVENGVIVDQGTLLGKDDRTPNEGPVPTRDWYGGSYALPLEWCLDVNGWSEDICDGCGYEDSAFGIVLRNCGYPMKYDSRMKVIQDRTPTEIEGALKRANKGADLPPPRPKDWQILRAFHGKTQSGNHFDIRDMRARKLAGEDWRPSLASHLDWYDNSPISEME